MNTFLFLTHFVCLYYHSRIDFSSLKNIVMEKIDLLWWEHDKKRAATSPLMDTDSSMTNEDLSWTVDVPVDTVKRIRSNLIEFSDIFAVLERSPKTSKMPGRLDPRS